MKVLLLHSAAIKRKQTLQTRLDALSSQLNVHNGIEEPAPKELKMNSIGRVRLLLSAPYPLETYAENKPMGRFILTAHCKTSKPLLRVSVLVCMKVHRAAGLCIVPRKH